MSNISTCHRQSHCADLHCSRGRSPLAYPTMQNCNRHVAQNHPAAKMMGQTGYKYQGWSRRKDASDHSVEFKVQSSPDRAAKGANPQIASPRNPMACSGDDAATAEVMLLQGNKSHE